MRASALARSGSLAALLALGGCLLGPNYERPAVDAPAAFRFAGPDATATSPIRRGGSSSRTRC